MQWIKEPKVIYLCIFPTLLCVVPVSKDCRIDLARWWFDAKMCRWKAIRSVSRGAMSDLLTYISINRAFLPGTCQALYFTLCGSVGRVIVLQCSYSNFLSKRICILRTIILLLITTWHSIGASSAAFRSHDSSSSASSISLNVSPVCAPDRRAPIKLG
jgi:hypothetical protein